MIPLTKVYLQRWRNNLKKVRKTGLKLDSQQFTLFFRIQNSLGANPSNTKTGHNLVMSLQNYLFNGLDRQ